MARQVNFIVIHCTGGPKSQSVASIREHWRRVMRWTHPGYHRLVSANGNKHVLAQWASITNGVEGFNRQCVHIAYTGGVLANGQIHDTRTPEQRKALLELVEEAHDLYPNAIIQGHRDFSPDRNRNGVIEPSEWLKACPSFSVKQWLQEVGFRSKASKPYLQTTAVVNIREGAGTEFKTVAPALARGTVVQVLGNANGWHYVQVGDTKIVGWVSSRFLTEKI